MTIGGVSILPLLSLVPGVVGIGFALYELARRQAAETKTALAERDAEAERSARKHLVELLTQEQDARRDEAVRWQGVLSRYQSEVKGLESDLRDCATPDAVRARLNRLLSATAAAANPGGDR